MTWCVHLVYSAFGSDFLKRICFCSYGASEQEVWVAHETICGRWWNCWQVLGYVVSPHHVYDIRFFAVQGHLARQIWSSTQWTWLPKVLYPPDVVENFEDRFYDLSTPCSRASAMDISLPQPVEKITCVPQSLYHGDMQKRHTDWVGYVAACSNDFNIYLPTFHSLASWVSWISRNDIRQGTVRGWRWLKALENGSSQGPCGTQENFRVVIQIFSKHQYAKYNQIYIYIFTYTYIMLMASDRNHIYILSNVFDCVPLHTASHESTPDQVLCIRSPFVHKLSQQGQDKLLPVRKVRWFGSKSIRQEFADSINPFEPHLSNSTWNTKNKL